MLRFLSDWVRKRIPSLTAGFRRQGALTPHALAMQYVESNWKKYEENFGSLVEDILLSKFVRYFLTVEILIATLHSSFQTGLVYHNLVHLPSYIILIGYPFIKAKWFPKKQHFVLNILVYVLVLEWLLSAWLYQVSGAWSRLSPGIGTMIMLVVWFLVSTPRRLPGIGIALGATILFFYLFRMMSPEFFKTNMNGLQMGALFGLCSNYLMSILFRYKFFFIEQEKSLREKTEEISRILSSVKHGIFQITLDGSGNLRVGERKSAHFAAIFGEVRTPFFREAILPLLKMNDSDKSMIVSALAGSIGEDAVGFEMNETCLPREASIQLSDGEEKIIEFVWTPLFSQVNPSFIDSVLVSTTDVTDLKRLSEKATIHARSTVILSEMLPHGRTKSVHFLDNILMLKAAAQSDLHGMPDSLTLPHMNRLFVTLHTIKGTSRALGFETLSSHVHDVENAMDQKRKGPRAEMSKVDAQESMEKVFRVIHDYQTVMASIGWQIGHKVLEISPNDARAIIDRTDILRLIENSDEALSELEESLRPFVRRLSSLMEEVLLGLARTAVRLNKPLPKLTMQGDAWLKNEAINAFSRIIPHIFVNSLDHGIEAADTREHRNKPIQGEILVSVERTGGDGWIVKITDDGQGVDPSFILQKAIERGVVTSEAASNLSDCEKASLIFAPNFSTKSDVNEFSGRGAGLDAVVHYIKTLGGNVRLELGHIGGRGKGRSSLTFCFSVDDHCFMPCSRTSSSTQESQATIRPLLKGA